jgi:arsenite methyltransferase
MSKVDDDAIREAVRARYAEAARAAGTSCCTPASDSEKTGASCCGSASSTDGLIGHSLYGEDQAEAGIENAEFLEGTMEDVPLPEASVDVIISNCVVNLSPNKDAVFREAVRVLRPGGRLAISDIVLRRTLPDSLQHAIGLWTGCVAGALVESDYVLCLDRAGFEQIDIEATQVYDSSDITQMAGGLRAIGDNPEGLDVDKTLTELDGAAMSAFVHARKPVN